MLFVFMNMVYSKNLSYKEFVGELGYKINVGK